jgi:SNF2 family DNA or RNA helicase
MSVGVSNCLAEVRRVLIICPASLKINWQREWQRWDTKGLSVGIAGKTYPDTDVTIINYDILKKWRKELRESDYQLMIIDEAHYLKNGKADRTREVFGGIKRASDKHIIERLSPIQATRKLLLTGTPILSVPREIWNIVKECDPTGLGADWFSFAKRYCKLFELKRFNPSKGREERIGWDWSGADNLEELQGLLRQRFMIRRLKKDVLTELPPKTRQIIVLEAKKNLTKLLECEKLSYEEYVKKHGDTITPSPAFTEYAKIRKEVAIAKIPYVIDYIKELLNETEKAVIWTHHHEVTDAIAGAFANESVVVDGRVPPEDRQHQVDRLQSDPNCRLFIGGIHSAGTGLTLTASSICVFAEIDWTPAVITQCEDRQHRIGQKENVLVRHIVLNGSLDQRIVQTLIRKQEIADKALDKETK